MISELIKKKENFFWAKSVIEENTITVGGHDSGRFLGKIEFNISKDCISMRVITSNGFSQVQTFPERVFIKGDTNYDLLSQFFLQIDSYLELETTKSNQTLNRSQLLQNLCQFLNNAA